MGICSRRKLYCRICEPGSRKTLVAPALRATNPRHDTLVIEWISPQHGEVSRLLHCLAASEFKEAVDVYSEHVFGASVLDLARVPVISHHVIDSFNIISSMAQSSVSHGSIRLLAEFNTPRVLPQSSSLKDVLDKSSDAILMGCRRGDNDRSVATAVTLGQLSPKTCSLGMSPKSPCQVSKKPCPFSHAGESVIMGPCAQASLTSLYRLDCSESINMYNFCIVLRCAVFKLLSGVFSTATFLLVCVLGCGLVRDSSNVPTPSSKPI